MRCELLFLIGAIAAGTALAAKPPIEISDAIVFRNACDASAAAAVDAHRFAAASDEENILRIYDRRAGGTPSSTLDLSKFLELDPRKPETDLEGAARLANRIYWISSHSRNRHGRDRPDRKRFFATDVVPGANPLVPVGRPYKRLLEDLVGDRQLTKYKLAEASRLAPKEPGALNIEGLAATPDGHLLIGFRNPVPNGQALIIPLLNPAELIEGRKARFGTPITLDLGGLGIRDMTLRSDKYVIIAGSPHGGGSSQLYHWKYGKEEPKLIRGGRLKGINPEAVAFFPGSKGYQIFCDSGKGAPNSVPCKDLSNESGRAFQSFLIED